MRFFLAVTNWTARSLYAVMKAVVPVRRKVVLLSRQSDEPSTDFVLLSQELIARDSSLEVVMSCRMLGRSLLSHLAALPVMANQMYHLAGASVCVVDGYVVPVSVLSHRRLSVVQMWHALGAVKRFGYQTLDLPGGHSSKLAKAMRMHGNYDLVVCGGEASVPAFAEALGVEETSVKPLGLPRMDHLMARGRRGVADRMPEAVADLWRRSPVLADPSRLKVLYAPTFRRGGAHGYADVIGRFEDDRFAVIVKPHPLETADARGANVASAQDCDILDLLPFCDVVITDYSAVCFEALVLDVPVYFYVHDIDRYRVENGLNIDPLDQFPEIASRDIDQIARWVEEGHGVEAMNRLKRRYLVPADGRCTERIVDEIMDRLPGDEA